MAVDEAHGDVLPTISFEAFWNWLIGHPNCIVRAGTPECILYDDEDYHWHFGSEGVSTLLVQVIRGKRLVSELLVDHENIAYVQEAASGREGEHVFQLMSESAGDPVAAYFFVLSHEYDAPEVGPSLRDVH